MVWVSISHIRYLGQKVGPIALVMGQTALNPKPLNPYLDPTEPTFLGFLIMISLYKSLKR